MWVFWQQGELPKRHKTTLFTCRLKLSCSQENDENDIFIMKMACDATGIAHQLQVVTDGAMCIDYLSGKDCYADRTVYPMPDVIFLRY